MLTQIENSKGIISFDSSLVDQLIIDALSKYKGQYKLIKKSSEMNENGVYIFINIHLKFGVSISKFSNDVFSFISEKITGNFELPIDSIDINISAVFSKKTAKRNILLNYSGKS